MQKEVKLLENSGIKFGKPYEISVGKYDTILYRSNTYQEFNEYRKMFYRGRQKIIRRKVLNLFEPIALAIWIQDDGSMCKGQNIIRLHTEGFTEREQKMICKYFASVWYITAKTNMVKDNLKCIVFGVQGTKKLIEIIKPFIFPSMEYKIELIPRMSIEERNKKFNLAGISAGIPTRFKKGHKYCGIKSSLNDNLKMI